MRYAVLSDIHGNMTAFECCLKQLESQKIDGFIFCGDYITDIPCYNEVLERIQELEQKYPCYIIRGNREDYIIDYVNKELDWTIGSNEEPLLWTRFYLSHSNFIYISKLPTTLSFNLHGYSILLTHSEEQLDTFDVDIVIVGHTHKQEIKKKENTILVNSGSVGLSCWGETGAYYSVIEFGDQIKIENYHIQYDIEPVIQQIKQSYLSQVRSHWDKILILTLKEGNPYSSKYIDIMKTLAKDMGFDESLDHLPPAVWNQGYEILLQEKWDK